MTDMNPVELEPAEKYRFWQDQIGRQLHSKMSQAQFCEHHGLKLNQFIYWKYKHGKQAADSDITFVSVPVAGFRTPSVSARSALHLVTAAGHRIEMYPGGHLKAAHCRAGGTMMLAINPQQVYLALGSTDMRKAINGLSIMVEQAMGLNPFSGDLFVFCNRNRSIIKILYWDTNGFALWIKRLEKHQFKWPSAPEEVILIGPRQLEWLLAGLDYTSAHKQLEYRAVA